MGHAFTICNRTENKHEASFSPFGQLEILVLVELAWGHLRSRQGSVLLRLLLRFQLTLLLPLLQLRLLLPLQQLLLQLLTILLVC